MFLIACVQYVFLSKNKILLFLISISKATSSFEIIYSYVWGPSPIIFAFKLKYFVIFI